MALQPSQLLEVRVFCTNGDQASVNVRHYRVDSITGTGPPADTVADELSGSFGGQMIPLLAAVAHYDGCGVRVIAPLPKSVEYYSTSGSGPGAVAGISSPRQVSGLISLRTALAGRRNRGRLYVPFPSDASNSTGGVPNALYIAALEPFALWLTKGLNVGLAPNQAFLVPVIYHRDLGTSNDIVGWVSPAKWATQRRRGSFGRPNISPI